MRVCVELRVHRICICWVAIGHFKYNKAEEKKLVHLINPFPFAELRYHGMISNCRHTTLDVDENYNWSRGWTKNSEKLFIFIVFCFAIVSHTALCAQAIACVTHQTGVWVRECALIFMHLRRSSACSRFCFHFIIINFFFCLSNIWLAMRMTIFQAKSVKTEIKYFVQTIV